MQLKKLRFRECCFRTLPAKGRKAVWEITHECFTDCPYCFQAKKRAQDNMNVLNENDILKIINKFRKLGINDVVLTGGEIFFAKHVLQLIVDELKKNKINYSISTNQLSIDFIESLLKLSPKALNLSLDPNPLNKISKYDKEVEDIKRVLLETSLEQIDIKLTAVVTRDTLQYTDEFFNLIDSFIKEFPHISAVYFTNPYEIGYIRSRLNPSHTTFQKWFKKTQLPENLEKRIHFVNFHRFNTGLQSCPAGEKLLHIEPNGNVYPCHLFANLPKEYYFRGNLLKDSVQRIEKNLINFQSQIKDAINEYKHENESCKSCKDERKCGGGCIAEIVSLGRLIEPELTCKLIKPSPPVELFKPSAQISFNFKSNNNDLTDGEEKKIIDYIQQNIRKGHDLAHGFDHVEMVVKYARYIAKKENANLRIVTAAAYFHDFEPRRKLLFEIHTTVSAQKAVMFLKKLNFNDYELDQIYHCIDNVIVRG